LSVSTHVDPRPVLPGTAYDVDDLFELYEREQLPMPKRKQFKGPKGKYSVMNSYRNRRWDAGNLVNKDEARPTLPSLERKKEERKRISAMMGKRR